MTAISAQDLSHADEDAAMERRMEAMMQGGDSDDDLVSF